MKKVCVITFTRAEYGVLKPVIEKINNHSDLQLQLIVTGTHLEKEYGYTIHEIEEDGFEINAKVKIICGDSKQQIIESMSKSLGEIGKVLSDLNPDMIVIDGDRYEMPPVALVAVILNIPIAHIGGGDVTEGAYDDAFRHTLTKLATLHFPSTEIYRNRIIQMGEQPNRVFNVGSTGVENILTVDFLSKKELEKQIGFEMSDNTLLVTFHPVTNESELQNKQFKALLDALEESKYRVIFTRPNADTNRDEINNMLNKFIQRNKERCIAFESMGMLRYLSAMKYCAGVVGNSSSGIIETPSMKVATINIGNRQKGRIKAESIIDCLPDKQSIVKALNKISTTDFKQILQDVANPYEGNNTSFNIVKEIYTHLLKNSKSVKKFYDL